MSTDASIVLRIKDNRTDWERNVFIRTLPEILSEVYNIVSCKDKTSECYYYFTIDNIFAKMEQNGEIVYCGYGNHAKGFHSASENSPVKKYAYLETSFDQDKEKLKAVVLNESYNVSEIYETMTCHERIPVSIKGFQILNDDSYLAWGTYERLETNLLHDVLGRRVQETVI